MDGQCNIKQREKSINKFKSDKECNVIIISLKTGGGGLNLVEANHVFLIDPWWNPAIKQ